MSNTLFAYLASLMTDVSHNLTDSVGKVSLDSVKDLKLTHLALDGSRWDISINKGSVIYIEKIEDRSTQANSKRQSFETFETFPDEMNLSEESIEYFGIPAGDVEPLT